MTVQPCPHCAQDVTPVWRRAERLWHHESRDRAYTQGLTWAEVPLAEKNLWFELAKLRGDEVQT